MLKRGLLLSLLVVAGCNPKFDEKKAAALINEKIGSGCFFITLDDPTDITFNTITRIYNKENKQISEGPTRSIISLAKNPNYEKQHRQLTALESVGLMDKTENHINPNKAGGYLSDIQGAPSNMAPTAKIPGTQYKLTKIGEGYVRSEPNTNKLTFCTGYLRVNTLDLPKTENGKLPDRFSASYTITVRDTPNWANDKTVDASFPVIKKAITEKNGSTGTAVFVKTAKGYAIEP